MKAAKIVWAGFLTGLGAATLLMSAASAEQSMSGMITKIDRLNGTVAIQQIQNGTVGANTGGATEFKVQDQGALESVHAGDRVTYAIGDDAKTITKLQKQ
ncbi:copper-binding protein [Bradyrhizobium sp.]|uniref:copper-binding protein n=1 Tax=Bradyrhizobium sp. TaxID=376 RepID=UPI001EC3DC09|nr:copper-binding protein [Bradyrhizobium sp.]MBV8920652.1 copper-binding protein [Bradyrhizobium sp.]MBV9982642.1 copper-binding protein [Bradyrhizobium sp.]